MPIDFTNYLEALQANLLALIEYVTHLFIVLDCAALLVYLASIAWLIHCEMRQPRNHQRQTARLTIRKRRRESSLSV